MTGADVTVAPVAAVVKLVCISGSFVNTGTLLIVEIVAVPFVFGAPLAVALTGLPTTGVLIVLVVLAGVFNWVCHV